MRKIKFRTWDKKKKKMIYPEFLVENDYGVLIPAFSAGDWYHGYYIDEHIYYKNQNDIEIMQYTEKQDKTGKGIYEGDICKIEFSKNETPYIGEVKFVNGKWMLGNTELFMRSHNCEVIGNVYENTELLKK